MHIDFILDTACIWSYIAKRRMEKALEFFPDVRPEIGVFFMSPMFGMSPYLRINPADRTRLLKEKIMPYLDELEINVRFDSLPALEDVSESYSLVQRGFSCGCGMKTLEAVFSAYFTQALDIGDKKIIDKIAKDCGLAGTPEHTCPPHCAVPLLKKEGLRCVPCFIFDRRTTLFGAQSTPCFKNMLVLARRISQEKNFLSG